MSFPPLFPGCKVTVVCFDSGKLNIAGLRDVVDGNAIFYTLRSLITDFRDDQSIVPKEQRYEARIERFAHYLAQNAEQRKEGTLTLKKRKVTTKEEEDKEEEEEYLEEIQMDTLDDDIRVLQALDDHDGIEDISVIATRVTHLMRACEKGQVNNVRILLENGLENPWDQDEQGLTALDRIKRLEDADEHIIALLEAHMKKQRN